MSHQDSGTISKLPTSYSADPKYDFLFRASGSSLDNLKIDWVQPTSTAAFYFRNFLLILLEIIESQGKQLEFDGYYISYLLGHIDEKEFEAIAENYISEKTKEVSPEQLKDKIQILQSLRGNDFTTREMAQFLHCDEADILKALLLLQG
jgi:hypothetical protein